MALSSAAGMELISRDTPKASHAPFTVFRMGNSPAVKVELDDIPAPPWLLPLSPEAREAAQRIAAQAPPLSDRQRERLRLLFRAEDNRPNN